MHSSSVRRFAAGVALLAPLTLSAQRAADLPPDQQRAMFRDNAVRIYRLEI